MTDEQRGTSGDPSGGSCRGRYDCTACAAPRPASPGAQAKTLDAAQQWLNGPLVVDLILLDVPRDEEGNADPDLETRYHVRHYPHAKATRVAVIAENTKWTSPGPMKAFRWIDSQMKSTDICRQFEPPGIDDGSP